MQIAHMHWYGRVKLYFKFNETTVFVFRLHFYIVLLLWALHYLKLAYCMMICRLISIWADQAPVVPYHYIYFYREMENVGMRGWWTTLYSLINSALSVIASYRIVNIVLNRFSVTDHANITKYWKFPQNF